MKNGVKRKGKRKRPKKRTKELSSSKYDIKGEGKMRVFEPARDRSAFQAILKELYVLRQAIDHQALTVDERVRMIDKIRKEIIQQVAQA